MRNRFEDICLLDKTLGLAIYELAERLFPLCRSITGNGVRKTLEIVKEEISPLSIKEIPSNTVCFDWTVPDEWNIKEGYIIGPDGQKIIDFKNNNLHVISYSEPIDIQLSLSELKKNIYTDPDLPEAIPYRTSYYERRWGFCMSHRQLESLEEGTYKAFIDSELSPGYMTYGELIIPGQSDEEVFLSTYICHPSMANNEISGIVVTSFIAKWLLALTTRKYTYRIAFLPETIGSICYLSENLNSMKEKTVAGFNVTCIGDNRAYSYLKSRHEDTLADRVAYHVLRHISENGIVYPFLSCSSDERQYCSPGVDLPVVSVMRSKYKEYPEYHTSLDNLDFISPEGLLGGYMFLKRCLECIELNERLLSATLCQPQLGKRGLYPNLSNAKLDYEQRKMVNLLMLADGQNLLDIADKMEVEMWSLYSIVDRLKKEGLLINAGSGEKPNEKKIRK